MKMKIKKITLALIAVALLSGCTKESSVMSQSDTDKVTIQIKAKAFIGNEVEGSTIEKVRFILFLNGELSNNYTTSNGTLNIDDNGQFNLAVSPGQYSFAAIINETPELTEKLNAVSKRTDIDAIKFDSQNSSLTSANVPMVNLGEIKIQPRAASGQGMAQLRPVYSSDGSRYKGDFTAASATANIDMPRAVSQVSLFLRQDATVTEEIKISNVQIVNIPRYSYLVDQLDTDNTKQNLFSGSSKTISATGGDKVYNSKQYHSFPTTIIPEKSFYKDGQDDEEMATNPDNATYLFINATYGGIPTTYKILLREGDANFRLLRNTNYNVYATIKQIGSKGIYVIIEPVKLYNITVNWSPVEGLVVISDREADFNKNVNVWSDYTVYSGILKVYKDDNYHDVLFKYGSLIAVNNDVDGSTDQSFVAPTDAETTNDIIWYPGNFNVTNITGWNDIPYIANASNITSGNTIESVEQGKGDPCRLAALSPHQIGVEKKIDNQQWHMATPEEYQILMKAANGSGSENTNGYRSFHELLVPNVKYRNKDGVLQSTHNNEGNYWSTAANTAFFFNSQNLTTAALNTAVPEQGYAIRCVRNVIPAANITIIPVTQVDYYGTAVNGSPFQVNTNVPYWKMELIKNGEHAGTSTDFNDFSFEPLATGITHKIEGSYSQNPKVYIARKESRTEDRTFGVKFTSMHFTGEESTFYFTIKQLKYSIKGLPTIQNLEANNRIKKEGGKYTIHIDLTPDDVPMPVGAKLRVQYSYLDTPRGEVSTEATITNTNQYGYDVELNILPNDTPDVIGLKFSVYMAEGNTQYREITDGIHYYYQNNK